MINIATNDLRLIRTIIRDNEVLYSKYITKLIKRAVTNNLELIPVFKSTVGPLEGVLTKEVYRSAIAECIEIFIKHEEYEEAQKATKIKDMVEVYFLVTETVVQQP